MGAPKKYSDEQLQEAFPDVSIEELIKNRRRYRRIIDRNGRSNWHTFRVKELPCQKPGCMEVSRRIISLKDGGRIRYCDTHYDEWFESESN